MTKKNGNNPKVNSYNPKNERKSKDDFIMSPMIDFAFKRLFGDERNISVLQSFLSAVLKIPKAELEEISLLQNELNKDHEDDKLGILDVRAKLKNGEQINIEIQLICRDSMVKRSTFYLATMYSNQALKGNRYQELKKCIAINIVNFNATKSRKAHSKYRLWEEKQGYCLTDILEIHFLELPKIKEEDFQAEDQELLHWLRFIKADSKEEMEMITQINPEIEKAYEILERLGDDEQARLNYMRRKMAIMDENDIRDSALREGIEQGIEQGKTMGRAEGIQLGEARGVRQNALSNARRMKADNVSVELISKYTGLSIEEIEEL